MVPSLGLHRHARRLWPQSCDYQRGETAALYINSWTSECWTALCACMSSDEQRYALRGAQVLLAEQNRPGMRNNAMAFASEIAHAVKFAKISPHEQRGTAVAVESAIKPRQKKRGRKWSPLIGIHHGGCDFGSTGAARPSVASRSESVAAAVSVVYSLTRSIVLVGTDIVPAPSSTSATQQSTKVVRKRKPVRPGLKWTRLVRQLYNTSEYVVASGDTALDGAACLLWVFLHTVSPAGSGWAAPHPGLLRDHLAALYERWVGACGSAFAPMVELLGGGEAGTNRVAGLVYGTRGASRAHKGGDAVSGWSGALVMAEAMRGVPTGVSFELVRRCCRDWGI
jgi:hypothetical protein